MSNQRIEIQHNEPAQVREWLDEALRMLEERELEPGEHPGLLVRLIELLSAKTIQEVKFVPPDLMPVTGGAIPPPFQGRR